MAFDGLAVACASALAKGSKVVVDGRLEHRTWQGKDGSKRSRHEVIAHEVVFLDAPPPTAVNGRRERRHEEPTSAVPDRERMLAAA